MALEAFLLPFADHFRKQGWTVDAMARNASDSPACRAAFDRVWDVPWSRNPRELTQAGAVLRRVRAIVAERDYDVVHVHTPIASLLVRLALRRMRQEGRPKVVYTAHGFHFHDHGHPVANAAFLAVEKLAGRWTDYLVTINRMDEAAARRHRIVPPERLRYMPGIGVDLSRYAPERVPPGAAEAVRGGLGLPGDAVLFLMIAEFNPGKRHLDALHALARLPGDVHLAFAGVGPLEAEVRAAAARLGVAARTHFLGWRQDVPALLRASRALVLPSVREGLPRSIMEALCLEVPAVGTNIRGVTELIPEGCGLRVPVGDVDGLAHALRYLAGHPSEAAAMGLAGRRHMATFSLAHVLDLHERLYREILNAPQHVAAAGGSASAFR